MPKQYRQFTRDKNQPSSPLLPQSSLGKNKQQIRIRIPITSYVSSGSQNESSSIKSVHRFLKAAIIYDDDKRQNVKDFDKVINAESIGTSI